MDPICVIYWLESDFLGFLAEWQNESQGMEYLGKSEK